MRPHGFERVHGTPDMRCIGLHVIVCPCWAQCMLHGFHLDPLNDHLFVYCSKLERERERKIRVFFLNKERLGVWLISCRYMPKDINETIAWGTKGMLLYFLLGERNSDVQFRSADDLTHLSFLSFQSLSKQMQNLFDRFCSMTYHIPPSIIAVNAICTMLPACFTNTHTNGQHMQMMHSKHCVQWRQC